MLTPTLQGSVITYEMFIFAIFLFVFLYSERTLNKLLSDVLDERAGGYVSSRTFFVLITYNSNLHVHSKVSKILFFRIKEKMNPLTLRFTDADCEFQVTLTL